MKTYRLKWLDFEIVVTLKEFNDLINEINDVWNWVLIPIN